MTAGTAVAENGKGLATRDEMVGSEVESKPSARHPSVAVPDDLTSAAVHQEPVAEIKALSSVAPLPFTPAEDRVPAGLPPQTRSTLAVNALRAKGNMRAVSLDHQALASVQRGNLAEDQVQLLRKLRQVVKNRIQMARNYRSLIGFAIYVGLYFFGVYTQRDTSKTYDIEQALLLKYIHPLRSLKTAMTTKTILDYFKQNVAQIFEDSVCGDGKCDWPGEFAGVQSVGCVADCGEHPNTTTVVVVLSDLRVPPGQSASQFPILQFANDSNVEPGYYWNAYSDNLGAWMFDADVPIVPGELQPVMFKAPDGNLSIKIFQRRHLYGATDKHDYPPSLMAQLAPADPSTVPEVPSWQGQTYGDFTEALGWNLGAKFQYIFQGANEETAEVNIAEYNPLRDEGLTLPVDGYVMLPSELSGQLLPVMNISQCLMSPRAVAAFLTLEGERCAMGAVNGSCYDLREMAAAWRCADEYRLELRRHSPRGEEAAPPQMKPAATPERFVTPSNALVGAVVIAQRRWAVGECGVSCQGRCKRVRERILGHRGRQGRCKSGEGATPFGVDPTFLPASSVFSGKHAPRDFYSEEAELAAPNVPFGFFPLRRFQGAAVPERGSEFLAYLDARMSTEQVSKAIAFLEEGFFLDNLTKSVSVTLLMHNAELDALAELVLTFSFSEGGSIYMTYSIMSMSIDEFTAVETTLVVAILVTLLSLVMMASECEELAEAVRGQRLAAYLTDTWNALDWASYVSVPASLWVFLWIALRMQHNLSIANDNGDAPHPLKDPAAEARIFEPDPERERLLLEIEETFLWYSIALSYYAAWTAANVLLLMFRLFKSLDFQGRMGLITRTFNRSFTDIVHFLLIFVFVLVSFAVMGQKLYGRQLNQFRDFGTCVMSLVRLTFTIGDDPYAEMLDANAMLRGFTALYYLTFFFLSSVVLVNIFLAILLEAFSEVKDSAKSEETITQGLAMVGAHDLRALRQRLRRALHIPHRDLRFLPDDMLLYLLDLWIASAPSADNPKPSRHRPRRASWGGTHSGRDVAGSRDGDGDGDGDGGHVVELQDGSQLTGSQLAALLRALIAEAPLPSPAPPRRLPTLAQGSAEMLPAALRGARRVHAEESEGAGAGGETRAQLSGGKAAFWESVRHLVSRTEPPDDGGEGGDCHPSDARSRRMEHMVESLMARYGKGVDEDDEEKKNLKFLKLEALERQLGFFDKHDALAARFDLFLEEFAALQATVQGALQSKTEPQPQAPESPPPSFEHRS